jgi:FecR protein
MKRTVLRLAVLAVALTGCTWAGDEDEAGRGVARVSLINGDVSVRRGDSGDWVAAAVNAPLVVQDSVVTGPSSRAEVQFDWANMIRLASSAEVRLAQLDYRRYLIQIARGTVTFRVLRDSEADVELSTPSVSVRPVRKGTYRITVREDGESEITVRSGEAEIFTPRGSERLKSGHTMLARGTASDPEFQMAREIPDDSWDDWNISRDRQLERAQGYRYANRSVYGVEDLDAYGSWDYVAPYGYVWAPRVAVGWSPYYYGRWSWIDWYGWSWVSYDPWGWAPYHYGRWFWHQSRWCWWPGGYGSRHYWSPGLVAFVGFGHGVGVGFSWGRVGWVPLAPYEPYHRWYGSGYYRGYRNNTYIDNSVTIVNNTNIYNTYRNARVNNAVTAVDASSFGRGNGNLVRVRSDELNRAGLVKGVLPVAPDRESQRVTNREVNRATLPRDVNEGRFYSRREVPKVERVPFEDQRRGMEQVARRTFGETAGRPAESVRATGGAVTDDARRGGAVRTPEGSIVRSPEQRGNAGWRRSGETPAAEARGGAAPAEGGVRSTPGDVRRSGTPAESGVRNVPSEVRRSGTPAEGSVRNVPSEVRRSGEADRGGWRRFGEPGRQSGTGGEGAAPRVTDRTSGRNDEVRTQGGNRGETVRSTPSEARGSDTERGSWRRFESQRNEPTRTETPRAETQRDNSSRYESPRSESSRAERNSEGRSIRVNPPVVRERETQRFDSGGFGEPRRYEAPRTESPRMDTPRYESPRYESPRMNAPRYEAPRSESPRMSAPRSEAPRYEAPRMSAPRGGGEARAPQVSRGNDGGGRSSRGESRSGGRGR